MPLFTCACTDFGRAISATGTSSACRSTYESGGGTAGARYKRSARAGCSPWAACSAATGSARTTRSGRATRSARTTWSGGAARSTRRCDQPCSSRRPESRCVGRCESRTICYARTPWVSWQQLVDRQVSQRRADHVADSNCVDHWAYGRDRANFLVGWPLVPT